MISIELVICPLARSVEYCATTSDINKILLHAYSGAGITGWYAFWDDQYTRDCYTGRFFGGPYNEYPRGSSIQFLNLAGFWAGGIVNGDTIVSRGLDYGYPTFYQYEPPFYKTILDPSSPHNSEAVSEQDIISTAEDTARALPLGIKVTKKSYAWSYQYAEDFILVDAEFENIGSSTIKSAFFGPWFDPSIGYYAADGWGSAAPGIGGFRSGVENQRCNGVVDSVPVAWFAHWSGYPIDGSFRDQIVQDERGHWYRPCPYSAAVVVLGYPRGKLEHRAYLSYNWFRHYPDWPDAQSFYGPSRRNQTRKIGYPESAQDLYYLMSNGEIDYDPLYSSTIKQNDPIWDYPPQTNARYVSDRGDFLEYTVSVGPYDLEPGQSVHIAYALVFGEHFHTRPNNADFLPDYPDRYYANLDFSDLDKNITWAKWIYDNPGVDTDSDGYAGELVICTQDSILTDSGWVSTLADTFYATGDGVPDWRPVSPPPSPDLWLEPLVDGIRIRFNGYRSETTKDVFSGIVDFEGYSVYLGRDEREQSLSLIASYDKEDYDRYVYNPASERYEVHGIPLPLDSLRCLYGRSDIPCADSAFDPLAYELPTHPYVHPRFPDSLFNFRKNSYNVNQYPTQTPIHKVYPDAPDPRGINPEDLTPDYFTEEGRLKFFEYECEVHNLLSSVQYWVSATAFDFGMPGTSIKPLESAKSINVTSCFVYANEGEQNGTDKQIYVYPNPYVASQDYRAQGYEGRTREDRPDYRTRAVNFANLPPKCTISIYSLDGDLVRKIDHDYSPNDPNYTHDYWDVITRNTEAPVSGLYYWTVEIPGAPTQIGKLVLIY